MRLSPVPPNDAFWSLTIYNAADKMLVANPIDRYKVGSDTPGLVQDAAGNVAIRIAARQPVDDEVNWLPAPAGPFYVILRIYQPRPAVIDGSYKLPELERAQ